MRLHSHLSIDPTDAVVGHDRPDLSATILDIGPWPYPGAHSVVCNTPMHVQGTAAERAAFLRRAALSLLALAVEVDAGTPDVPVSAYGQEVGA